MAKIIELTVPPSETDALVDRLSKIEQVAGIKVQRGVSVKPPGDVISVQLSSRAVHPLLHLLKGNGVGDRSGTSLTLSDPTALLEPAVTPEILGESTDSTWEEMHQMLARESNMTVNSLILMFVSGCLAAYGLSNGALHMVIAAMLIAPGFEPITRIALGLVSGSEAWRRGLIDTGKSYLVLLIGSGVMAALLPMLGLEPLQGPGSYLEPPPLVDYWSSTTASSLLLSFLVAFAGATLIAVNRTVLFSGAMVGLALIPAASLMGISLVSGRPDVAGASAQRWFLEILLVLTASVLVFLWKRGTVIHRGSRQ